MKKDNGGSCSSIYVYYFIAILLFAIIPEVIKFFQNDPLTKIIEFFTGVAILLGILLIGFILLFLFANFTSPDDYRKLKVFGPEYQIRCDHITLQVPSSEVPTAALSAPPVEAPETPIYFLIANTSHGVRFSLLTKKTAWKHIPADNADRFHRITNKHLTSFIAGRNALDLRYLMEPPPIITDEAVGNNKDGYEGALPEVLPWAQFQIILSYTDVSGVMDDKTVSGSTQQGAILHMVALNKYGKEDRIATLNLYELLYKHLHPPENDDDYGWMGSRPMYW